MRHALPGKPRDPFSAALDALRERLGNGRLILGEPLTITELADELGLSATPVREALSRLAGAGLIEDRRGRGYFARRIDVADLTELYGLRQLYLLAAGEAAPEAIAMTGESAEAPGQRLAQIFHHRVAAAGNRALMDAYRTVSEQLAPAVRVEGGVFALDAEVARFEVLAIASAAAWSEGVIAFHAERRSRAGDLVRAMRAHANISSL